ncbi:carbohydrate sulfotransferase 11-like [Ischnura elegans]|uniref:carbohydrate sulfotransferase 11-like n=1 Tax=Ischnura elegans TaxID=197161 RepID=UPI001ED87558|nr:carbohydrate sulfotransferase 11-like [Ischnura elegans]
MAGGGGEADEKPPEPNAWEFFIDERHRLVWCNVFKAASSSWMYNFNLLAGYKEQYLRRSKKSPLALARERFPRPSVEQLKAALPYSLSFLIVRDPFERLLSAYRNKIEGFRHKFYRKMAREMTTKFRVKTTPVPGNRRINNYPKSEKAQKMEKSPTFSEFVSWVIASAKRTKGTRTKGSYNGIPGFDEHWAPYFRFCTPCAVNFTVIAKTDTLNRDEEYIIEKTGIGPAIGRKPGKGKEERHRPREAVNAAVGGRTQDLLPKYYRTLSREQLDGLYDIYRIDFQMFGYDASKYFEIVPPASP